MTQPRFMIKAVADTTGNIQRKKLWILCLGCVLLVYLCFYNKLPATGKLIKNINLFLTILEPWKSIVKVLVSGEGLSDVTGQRTSHNKRSAVQARVAPSFPIKPLTPP